MTGIKLKAKIIAFKSISDNNYILVGSKRKWDVMRQNLLEMYGEKHG